MLYLLCFCFLTCSNTKQEQLPTLVLVHGGWHGAWSWYKVIPLLENKGYPVVAIDLPGNGSDHILPETVSFEDYVEKIQRTAQTIKGPIILVGHSSAGTAIAQASEQLGTQKVKSLVFLDAFMPNNGESVFSLVGKYADPNLAAGSALGESIIVAEDGQTCTLNTTKVQNLLYHDCNETDYQMALQKLSPQPIAALATPAQLTDDNYGQLAKYYILCTEAKDFDKRKMTENVPVKKLFEIESGHSPFFSKSDELVRCFIEIVDHSSMR